MLIEFSVENFRSFRERVSLSLVASRDKANPDNVIVDAQGSGINLLRTVGIFGANASGKSNLILAFNFMRRFVGESHVGQKGMPIAYSPFKLDAEAAKKPSVFEAVFLLEGVRYVYGFAVDGRDVQGEWLHAYPKSHGRLLFEREHSGAEEPVRIKFGSSWSGEKSGIAALTRHNALFLSTAGQYNHPLAAELCGWFSHFFSSVADFQGGEISMATLMMMSEPATRKNVVDILKCADLGITDYELKLFRNKEDGTKEELVLQNGFKVPPNIKNVGFELNFHHQGMEGMEAVPIAWHDESAGTQKFFALLGPMLALASWPACFYADELGGNLHPSLLKMLVMAFQLPMSKFNQAQLIFTTHAADLLDEKDVFRRDQVWITEKDASGASSLRSLSHYKIPRREENLRKGYLAGRYGGVPMLSRFDIGRQEHAVK